MASQPWTSIKSFLPAHASLPHTAAIALGSNLGDRFANIEHALRLLENPAHVSQDSNVASRSEGHVAIVDTSFMYETAPIMQIETTLEPLALLAHLKCIEIMVGRVPSVRNGPRAVDLDILLFDDKVIDTREEDKRNNLEDLSGELVTDGTIETLLGRITAARTKDEPVMRKVIPFPRYPEASASKGMIPGFKYPVPSTATHWSFPSSFAESAGKTYIMATLNATPDSFSDGSEHNTIPTAVAYANSSAAAGADIIDVGGYSTRPGAPFVSEEEEISRVVPTVSTIRGSNTQVDVHPKTKEVLISVDTFRWKVAQETILAGANCINDVYSFTGPEYPLNQASADHLIEMRRVARDLAVPVVLMHSRGDAGSNKDYEFYKHAVDSPILEAVRTELGEKVDVIVKGRNGLRRWLAIIDPGVGFSKSLEDNLELLRHSSLITKPTISPNPLAGYPQLIGTSRKSFLGVILAKASEDGTYQGRKTDGRGRLHATAAAVACAVQQRATIVRVHDVEEMIDVVRVASALWG
ncbi:hypothetical protein HWV62_22311 [Athelia sp. TMB]|nr:hypothetical protein HWV62_22311 [Athelia sp. TMB]